VDLALVSGGVIEEPIDPAADDLDADWAG